MTQTTNGPAGPNPALQPSSLEDLYRLKGELVTALEIAQMRLNQVNQQLQPRLGIVPLQVPPQNG